MNDKAKQGTGQGVFSIIKTNCLRRNDCYNTCIKIENGVAKSLKCELLSCYIMKIISTNYISKAEAIEGAKKAAGVIEGEMYVKVMSEKHFKLKSAHKVDELEQIILTCLGINNV